MKQLIRCILTILGPNSTSVYGVNYNSKQRFLNLLIVILFITFVTSLLENIMLNNTKYAIISGFGSVLMSFMYYLSRFKNIYYPVAASLFAFLLFCFVPIVWFEKGLTKSVLPFLFILIAVFSTYIFNGKTRILIISLSFLLMLLFSIKELFDEGFNNIESINHSLALILTVIALISIGYYSLIRFTQEKQKVEELSKYDFLTQLLTRREGMEKFLYLVEYTKRMNRELSLIMMDLDDFKRVNDTYGHICGDYVLKRVAKIIKNNIRQTDIAIRWGGEEFLVVLPETNLTKAYLIAERIRKDIEKADLSCSEKRFKITITCGVALYDFNTGLNENINTADRALYKGKRTGKNKTAFI